VRCWPAAWQRQLCTRLRPEAGARDRQVPGTPPRRLGAQGNREKVDRHRYKNILPGFDDESDIELLRRGGHPVPNLQGDINLPTSGPEKRFFDLANGHALACIPFTSRRRPIRRGECASARKWRRKRLLFRRLAPVPSPSNQGAALQFCGLVCAVRPLSGLGEC